MKTGFNNALKDQGEGKQGKYPFDFKCPSYDERSSCYIQAGQNYGVGHKQPVGNEKVNAASPIPKGRVNTLNIYEGR